MIPRRSPIVLFMMSVYVFLAPLGNLARFGQEEGAFGLTTILLIVITVLSAPVTFDGTAREPVFRAVGVLVLWMLAASVFAPEPDSALLEGVSLLLYLFAAVAAYYYVNTEHAIYRLLFLLCLSGFISAGATIIDGLGLVHIPGVNEVTIGTHTDLGVVMQMSGPFARRTAMAAYYGFVIVIGFLVPMLYQRTPFRDKLMFYGAAVLCIVAMMLTHNRAAILGAALAISIAAMGSSHSLVQISKTIAISIVIVVAIVITINIWFPGTWDVYQRLLGIEDALVDQGRVESDYLRIQLFLHSLQSILSNPMGHGYSLLSGVLGYGSRLVDPHSIISQIIWGAGLFGVIWLLVFGSRACLKVLSFLRSRNKKDPIGQLILVLIGAMLTFILIGMVHTIISTGIAWILFGVLKKTIRLSET